MGVLVARGECLKTVGVDVRGTFRLLGPSVAGSVVVCDSGELAFTGGGESLYEKLAPPTSGVSKSAGPFPASTHGRQKT
jgi:hypothetical protein